MPEGMISTMEEIAAWRKALDVDGRKLVLTNGAFDVLHVGHVRYLREAARLGDALVVAINSDSSVRELKGPSRPVYGVEERAEILLALESVDRVVVFEERRATRAIESIRPHIYTKGGDYSADSLIDEERELLDRLGIEIRILSLVPGQSTSVTVAKMSAETPGDRSRRIAILGSGKGGNARAILSAAASGKLGAEVALVLSDDPDAGILEVAADFGVAALVLDPGTTRKGHLTDAAMKELTDRLKAHEVDWIVLAGFMRILRPPLLATFPDRILNLHPSLLPSYPGIDPVKRALEAGERVTGCTVHLVDSGVDTGRVLRQAEVPVEQGDTVETLTRRIHEVEHRIYPEVIAECVAAGRGEVR